MDWVESVAFGIVKRTQRRYTNLKKLSPGGVKIRAWLVGLGLIGFRMPSLVAPPRSLEIQTPGKFGDFQKSGYSRAGRCLSVGCCLDVG